MGPRWIDICDACMLQVMLGVFLSVRLGQGCGRAEATDEWSQGRAKRWQRCLMCRESEGFLVGCGWPLSVASIQGSKLRLLWGSPGLCRYQAMVHNAKTKKGIKTNFCPWPRGAISLCFEDGGHKACGGGLCFGRDTHGVPQALGKGTRGIEGDGKGSCRLEAHKVSNIWLGGGQERRLGKMALLIWGKFPVPRPLMYVPTQALAVSAMHPICSSRERKCTWTGIDEVVRHPANCLGSSRPEPPQRHGFQTGVKLPRGECAHRLLPRATQYMPWPRKRGMVCPVFPSPTRLRPSTRASQCVGLSGPTRSRLLQKAPVSLAASCPPLDFVGPSSSEPRCSWVCDVSRSRVPSSSSLPHTSRPHSGKCWLPHPRLALQSQPAGPPNTEKSLFLFPGTRPSTLPRPSIKASKISSALR